MPTAGPPHNLPLSGRVQLACADVPRLPDMKMRLAVLATLAALGVVAVPHAGSLPTRFLTGTPGADVLRGTARGDTIRAGGGNDRLFGLGGSDYLEPGSGRDLAFGGRGDDRVQAQDGSRDLVACGPGRDVVTADPVDRLRRDCEIATRRISRDPYTNTTSQHQTEVEPDTFAFGSTVVSAFQAGRFLTGGASNIGFATSRNAGRSWTSGFLPSLTTFSRPAGPASRATDPSVAYDAVHRVWLIASLVLALPESGIVVSRSPNGVNWSAPVTVAPAPGRGFLAYDKEWIACDNGPASPFRGSCYISYGDFVNNRLSTQVSRDGGLTWSAPVGSPDRAQGVGTQPVVRPNGELVVTYLVSDGIAAIRSTTGGASFSRQVPVARVVSHRPTAMRAAPLPSSEVDAAGRVYVAWHDCRFRAGCSGNDIVLSTSSDGLTWSAPQRVPAGRNGSRADHFLPGIAVDPATTGTRGRVAIVYYSFADAACSVSTCRLNAGFVSSRDGGASWSRPRLLNAQPMRLSWIARSRGGRMLGDYISSSFAAGRAVSVFALAAPPHAGRFREAMFATAISVSARRR